MALKKLPKISVVGVAVIATNISIGLSAYISKTQDIIQCHISSNPDQWKNLEDIKPDPDLCTFNPSVICFRVVENNSHHVNLQYEGIYLGD